MSQEKPDTISRCVGWALVLVLPRVVVAIGCGGYGGGGGGGGSSSGNGGSSKQTTVSLAKCRKLVGATMFRLENVPFTAKNRNAIDSFCEGPGLKSTSPGEVGAAAEVAKQIAHRITP
jgi:hypothetical protein